MYPPTILWSAYMSNGYVPAIFKFPRVYGFVRQFPASISEHEFIRQFMSSEFTKKVLQSPIDLEVGAAVNGNS